MILLFCVQKLVKCPLFSMNLLFSNTDFPLHAGFYHLLAGFGSLPQLSLPCLRKNERF